MQSQTTLPLPKYRPSVFPHIGARAAAPLIMLLVLALALWLAAQQVLVPPAVVPATAPAADFSGERAMTYLRVIAQAPHPVGSPAQAGVRDYILQQIRAMGLTPMTQAATGAIAGKTGLFASGLNNILVRVPGTASTGAVALMAHYDSQPNTPGASDNGAAAAGLLESMRALQAGPRVRNDVIFILSDAEEVDAQGAEAFFWQHPWAKDIRLLVNFEAAGDTGPSLLMETSAGNAGLVDGFARAVPHPVAYSFLTQLLSAMPLGTDMTVFAENGVPSLSPMFGWHYRTMYHSMLDNTTTLDPRSVQQQGENGLSLARTFGNQDLTRLNTREDAVFFTLLPGLLIQYPAGWAMPLAGLAGLLLAGTVAAGLHRHRLTLGGILAGTAIGLAGVLAPTALAAVVWMGIAGIHPEYWRSLMGAPYRADLYLAGFAALVTAASLTIFVLARRKATAAHLTLGALLIWFVMAVLTSLALPGMSYLFTWPVLATILVLAGDVFRPQTAPAAAGSAASWAWLSAVAIAGAVILLIVVPVAALVSLLIGFWFTTMDPALPFIAVSMFFVALMLGLLTPQMELLTHTRKWLAPGIAALLAAGCIGAASLLSGFDTGQPMQNGVWYELNADSGQAAWYSFGEKPADPWTAQFFRGAIEPVRLADIYAAVPGNPTPPNGFKGAAPAAPLPAPELTVVADQSTGDVRTLRLHLSSPRLARGLRVKVSGAPVLAAAVNGIRQADPAWAGRSEWYLRYYGLTAAGVDLVLEVKPSQALSLVVADQSDGLPELPGVTYAARTPDMMPFDIAQEYMPYPETASVSKTFKLP